MSAETTFPHMTGEAVSAYLGFGDRWLRKLEAEGFVQRLENGKFDAGSVCLGYIRWLKDPARQRNKSETAKRKEAAQAEKIELETAQLRRQLVDIDDVDAAQIEILGILRRELGAVPAGITRDLALRKDIEDRLNDAFERCGAALRTASLALRAGGDPLDTVEDGES